MAQPSASEIQIGGNHYDKTGEQHWDRAYRLEYDPFQYIITKWVERWRKKGGIEDLRKAKHALDRYIEVAEIEDWEAAGEPGPGYVNQD